MGKIKFGTAYGEVKHSFTNPGEQIEPVYGYEVNAKGQKILVKTGEKNTWEEIQSYLEETKIANVLKRVAVGDMSDFRPQGIYADISEIPNNLIQAKQEIAKLENMWAKLPQEIKEKYNNSVEEFTAKAGEEAWLIDMGYIKPEEPEAAPKIEPAKDLE